MLNHSCVNSARRSSPAIDFYELTLSNIQIPRSKWRSTKNFRLIIENIPSRLTCNKCDMIFSEASCLIRHMRRQHSRNEESSKALIQAFKCAIQECNKKFVKFRYLQMHMKRSHNEIFSAQSKSFENPFPCPHSNCEKSFTKPRYIREHCIRVHGVKRK